MQNHCVSTSMQFFDNNCLSHQKLCFAYASASQKENNCASHDCCVPHHCRLVSNLFEIRHAKHLWFSHAKKNFPSHITRPLLNWRRPETCKTKQKQFHLPRTFLQENHASCRPRQKNVCLVLVVPCDMQKTNMLRGPFVQHELRPKWPLPVLCYTHRLLSS